MSEPLPTGWRTASELHSWRLRYDHSPAVISRAELGAVEWTECISSDLTRAVSSAHAIFPGPVEKTNLLREPEFAQFRTGHLRLPVGLWRWILWLSWLTGHRSQRVCRDEFRRRVRAAADLVEARHGNVLVVSHAGMMAYLSTELRARGFVGPKLRMARHGKLYVYEKDSVLGE